MASNAIFAFGAVHKLRHIEGGDGISASMMMYTLNIYQYGKSYDGGGGGGGGVHNEIA